MTFKLSEIMNWRGRPVCLYEFAWGATIWRYTSADRDISHGLDGDGNPIVWTAVSISDNGFTQGPSSDNFEVELPRSTEIAQLFIGTPPSTTIWLTCWRFHRDDPDDESAVYWVGTVSNVGGEDAVKAKLVGIPLSGRERRTGLRLGWESGCNHALYDADCRVNPADHKFDTTITALTGTTVTVAGFGSYTGEEFAGGYLEWQATAEGTFDRRAIESFGDGTTLNLLGMTDRLEVGQAVSLYVGCDLSPQTCGARFNNIANHGGFEYMAGKSPFDGQPTF